MFGLFKNSDKQLKINDKVWMSSLAKWNACKAMAQANNSCIFLAWFPETFEHIRNILPQHQIALADSFYPESTHKTILVFVEHYPLATVEESVFKRLGLSEVPVLSALDEPFFEKFGGEKTIDLMQKLGMKDDEVIAHSLITKSIRSAQSKIAAKVIIEVKTDSQKSWLEINLR